jgi:hypothetical protein
MTPEGKVKQAITKFLKEQEDCWWAMPVVSGYGKPLLDYIGCSRGRFFAIEAKSFGKPLTPRQQYTIVSISMSRGQTFIVRDTEIPAYIVEWFKNET